MRLDRIAASGSVVSGVLASACCLGPLVFALLGISGAASARAFEPARPYLLVLTYALLGYAFFSEYKPAPDVACAPGAACAGPRRFGRALLWAAALVVALATAFPWYVPYLPL